MRAEGTKLKFRQPNTWGVGSPERRKPFGAGPATFEGFQVIDVATRSSNKWPNKTSDPSAAKRDQKLKQFVAGVGSSQRLPSIHLLPEASELSLRQLVQLCLNSLFCFVQQVFIDNQFNLIKLILMNEF